MAQMLFSVKSFPAIRPLSPSGLKKEGLTLSATFGRSCAALFIALLLGCGGAAYGQNISTIAGNGVEGYTGDGGPATSAEIYWPYSIAADGSGNVYLGGDYYYYTGYLYNNRVRVVNSLGIINTFAGNGTSGFSGDGGPATAAEFRDPGGVATDGLGNVYVMDDSNFRIRKINTSGIVTTIAGTGISGYTGDGGPATAAEIFGASSYYYYGNEIASDPYGNLYFYTWGNWKVRKIDTAGIITTIAGSGIYGYSGDGGAATAANLGELYGIAADGSGNIYLGDWAYARVRKINSSGIITTIAGDGVSGYAGDGGAATAAQIRPLGVSVDYAGNMYIADYSNHRIRKVNSSGVISTVAGTGTGGFSGDGGPATAAMLYYPWTVTNDPSGNVFIGDGSNVRVRKINNYNRPPRFTGRPSQTFSVCENSAPDSFNSLMSIMDSDSYQLETWNVLVAASHGTVYAPTTATSTGAVITPHGLSYKPTTGYAGLDTFKMTVNDGFALDTITIYVTVNPVPAAITGVTSLVATGYSLLGDATGGGAWSSGSSAIAAVGSGSGLVTGATVGTSVITYTLPTGCNAVTTVNVFAYAGQVISTIAGNGTAAFSGDGGAALSAALNHAYGVITDAAGNFYIADALNNRIRKVNSSGVISTIAGTGTPGSLGDGGAATAAQLYGPIGIAIDGSGNLYVADQDNHKIRKINTSGVITTVAGTGVAGYTSDGVPATASELNYPTGLTVDASGNVFIADQYNHRIRKVNTSGIISTVAGNGTGGYIGDGLAATVEELNNPDGVAVDASGNIYIADYTNYRVRKVNSSGIISTISGSGTSAYGGDGGPATAANFMGPFGITLDALNNIYVSDQINNRVRKINTSGIISTVAGNGTAGYTGDLCAATASELNLPTHIAIDGSGQVYIADHGNNVIRRVGYNHAPYFILGHNRSTSVCENSVDSLNTILSVADVDNGQGETWSVITAALHGSATAAYTTTSTGGLLIPTGLYYAPTAGYTGTDSFLVRVSDCGVGSDTIKVVVTVTLPPSVIGGTPLVCPGLTTLLTDPPGTGSWSSSAPTIASVSSTSGLVTGVAAGTAIIMYSPGAGCTVTKTVTVSTPPSAISGPSFVCLGQTVTFTDGSSGGSWSRSSTIISIGTSSGAVTGSALGVATITYTQGGCIALKNISVNAYPSGVTGPTTLCAGSNAGLFDPGGGVWNAGTPLLATIDSFTGVVVGVSAGNALITYTLPGGCSTTYTITISPVPSPITGPTVVCIGDTILLHDSTAAGIWGAGPTGIGGGGGSAVINPVNGAVTGSAPGSVSVAYTTGSCSALTTVTVNTSPSPIVGGNSICTGGVLSLYGSGGGSWSSSNTSVATVGSATGVAYGVTAGTAIISYTISNHCSARDTLSVNPSVPAISGTANVCVGLTTALGDSLTGGTWTISSISASIASIGSASGVVRGLGAGSAVVTYTLPSGCFATVAVSVNSAPPGIAGTLGVCVGSSTVLSDLFAGGTWTSSVPTTATVGSTGTVNGLVPGMTTITYSIGTGCTTSSVVTVNALPTSITGTAIVCAGLTTTLNGTPAGGSWSNTSGTVASVGTGTGVVTGVAGPGVSAITYTLATGCSRAVNVTVNAVPFPVSGSSTVCPGGTIVLTDGTTGGSWSSLSPGTASVVGGTVTGNVSGTAIIHYTLGTGCYAAKTITVNTAPSPIGGPGSVCVGAAITLTDAGGTWSTGSAAASVGSASGVVTGILSGSAVITYTGTSGSSLGCYVTQTVTVSAPTAIGGPSAVCAGATITLTAAGGSWASGNAAVATIGAASGILTGVTTGTVTVICVFATGCQSSTVVTVSSAPSGITGTSLVCAGTTATLTATPAGGVWSSSVATSASVGSLSGIVSGLTAGTSTMITYSLGTGCTVSQGISVGVSPASIHGAMSVCTGATTTLTDATGGGTWSSSGSGATVGSTGVVSGVAAGVVTISYTVSGCPALASVTVNATPVGIGGPVTVCAGDSISETDGTTGGVWSTASGLITIGAGSGVVHGTTGGTAVITYSIGGCLATRSITVNPIAAIAGATGICSGLSTTLSDATPGGTWTSATGAVATIGTSGVLTAVSPGTTVITYVLATGCSATLTVTVSTAPTGILGTLHVCAGTTTNLSDAAGGGLWSASPAATATIGSSSGIVTGRVPGTAVVTYSLGTGCTTTATVTVSGSPSAISGPATVCAGSSIPLADVTGGGTWSSSNSATATVSSSGVVTGVAAGVVTISYSISGCPALYVVSVNGLPSAISGGGTLCRSLTTTLSDTASGGVWSSSNPLVAAVGSLSGTVTGIAPGTATITYGVGTGAGCNATTVITVIAGPSAIPVGSVCIGYSRVLTDSVTGGIWSSSDALVATIGSSSGLLTGIAPGLVTISYTAGSCTVSETINVNLLPSGIVGGPGICVSETRLFTDATGSAGWSSSNPLVASADAPSGLITGVTAGTATITYSLGVGCIVTTPITVNPLPLPVTGASYLCIGSTATLGDASAGGVWSSSNTGIATITGSGLATALAGGTDTILYTLPTGCAWKHVLPVIAVPAISGPDSICAWGDTLRVSDSMAGGIFTSSSVTVSNLGGGYGLVTGNAPGTGTVTYTIAAGCSISMSMRVNPLPGAITGNNHLCAGITTGLSDATGGGSWSSGSAGVASVVSGTGMITGVTAGVARITYSLPTGCRTDTLVYVHVPPSVLSLSGTAGAGICAGSTALATDSVSGGSWSSSNAAVASVSATSGLVSGVSAGTATITYTLGASCMAVRVVTVNAAPELFITTGGGSYCAGGTGVAVWLSGSQPGVSYAVYNGVTVLDTTAGTGMAMSLGLETLPGIYTVRGITSSGCGLSMAGSAVISVNPLPAAFAVIGGGNYCAGGAGMDVSLSGSVPGVSYQLYDFSAASGAPVAGTGSVVDFGLKTVTGSYTAVATNTATGCIRAMTGGAFIGTIPTVTPSVTVMAVGGDTLCAGTAVSLTTMNAYGGTSPAYSWQVNGSGTGVTGAGYTYVPANGDVVRVTMTSNAVCATPATASDSVSLTVAPEATPVVTVTASPGTTVTTGQAVTYSAAVTGGGGSPTYQWLVNGVAVAGATNATYSSVPQNGDIVSCAVVSSGACGGHQGSGSVTLIVTRGVGVGTVSVGADIRVLPNPNKGSFTVSGTVGVIDEQVRLLLTDMLGQEVYRGVAQAAGGKLNERISVGGNLANGVYLLNVRTASGTYVFHVVVEQ